MGIKQKKVRLFRDGHHSKASYYNALTCNASELLRLAALFLWIMLCLASLSNIELTLGKSASAALRSVVLRNDLTALRVVLW